MFTWHFSKAARFEESRQARGHLDELMSSAKASATRSKSDLATTNK